MIKITNGGTRAKRRQRFPKSIWKILFDVMFYFLDSLQKHYNLNNHKPQPHPQPLPNGDKLNPGP